MRRDDTSDPVRTETKRSRNVRRALTAGLVLLALPTLWIIGINLLVMIAWAFGSRPPEPEEVDAYEAAGLHSTMVVIYPKDVPGRWPLEGPSASLYCYSDGSITVTTGIQSRHAVNAAGRALGNPDMSEAVRKGADPGDLIAFRRRAEEMCRTGVHP